MAGNATYMVRAAWSCTLSSHRVDCCFGPQSLSPNKRHKEWLPRLVELWMCQWTLSYYLQPPGESPVANGHLPGGYRVISVLDSLTEVFTLGTSSVCHMYYRLQNDARVSLTFRLIWFVKRLLRKKKISFSLKTCLCVIWKKMSFAHLLRRKQEFFFFL